MLQPCLLASTRYALGFRRPALSTHCQPPQGALPAGADTADPLGAAEALAGAAAAAAAGAAAGTEPTMTVATRDAFAALNKMFKVRAAVGGGRCAGCVQARGGVLGRRPLHQLLPLH